MLTFFIFPFFPSLNKKLAIWIGGTFIGGCNDGPNEYGGIINLQQTGQLTELVAAAVKSSWKGGNSL